MNIMHTALLAMLAPDTGQQVEGGSSKALQEARTLVLPSHWALVGVGWWLQGLGVSSQWGVPRPMAVGGWTSLVFVSCPGVDRLGGGVEARMWDC